MSFQHIILFQTLLVLFLIGGRDNYSFSNLLCIRLTCWFKVCEWDLEMKIQNNRFRGESKRSCLFCVGSRKVTACDFYSKHVTRNGCLESPQKTKVGFPLLWESWSQAFVCAKSNLNLALLIDVAFYLKCLQRYPTLLLCGPVSNETHAYMRARMHQISGQHTVSTMDCGFWRLETWWA